MHRVHKLHYISGGSIIIGQDIEEERVWTQLVGLQWATSWEMYG